MIVPKIRKTRKSWMVNNEDSIWTALKIKTILQFLFDSNAIFDWTEDDLKRFVKAKGLQCLTHNRHTPLLENLVRASRSVQGIVMLRKYAFSYSEIPPGITEIEKILEHETPFPRKRIPRNELLEW